MTDGSNAAGAASSSSSSSKGGAKGKKKAVQQLSEEDQQLKANIELLVEKAADSDAGVQRLALETLRSDIRTASSSMTSIPKPLKFLRPQFDRLKAAFAALAGDAPNRALFADILSVLAMTFSDGSTTTESLAYKLLGTHEAFEAWGHDFVRNLSGEIAREFDRRQKAEQPCDDLLELVRQIVPYHIKHNAEPEACDLLLEVNRLPEVVATVDAGNYARIGQYLLSIAQYLPEPDDTEVLRVAFQIYMKEAQRFDAMRVALKIGDAKLIHEVFDSCTEQLAKKQLAFLLARHRFIFETGDAEVDHILSNGNLSNNFIELCTDLDILEPKSLDDIYKPHLEQRNALREVDSARHNLASTFVNAFVNAGFRRDKLLTVEEQGSTPWIYMNRDHAMMSAAASLGVIHLWDVESGTSQLNKYLYMADANIRAGACLGIGLVSCGVRDENDPALALLLDQMTSTDNQQVRTGCVVGLGLAYAGSARLDIAEHILPILQDDALGLDALCPAGLALGMVFVGSCNNEIAQAILTVLMERGSALERNSAVRYLSLGLGLVFLGKREACEVFLSAAEAIEGAVGKYTALTIETCAYAGSGDVLKIQHLLEVCGEVVTPSKGASKDDQPKDAASSGAAPSLGAAAAPAGPSAGGSGESESEEEADDFRMFDHQAVAVIGIAVVAMSEDIGSAMTARSFDHLMQYGDAHIRRAIPIALGLKSVSDPEPAITDTLSKLTHDADLETAQSAIIALGLIGAGSNNSRIAGLLRNLAVYYAREANALFCVRLAQGLLHIGKGAMTLSPFHSDRYLLDPVALSGLLVLAHSSMDMKHTLLGRWHFMLFHIVLSMMPRMLMTVGADLKPLPVSVRVGQSVDTVGQAGRPKTITGFQTHTSPVLLSAGERAELATSEYRALSSVMEGVVILVKNAQVE